MQRNFEPENRRALEKLGPEYRAMKGILVPFWSGRYPVGLSMVDQELQGFLLPFHWRRTRGLEPPRCSFYWWENLDDVSRCSLQQPLVGNWRTVERQFILSKLVVLIARLEIEERLVVLFEQPWLLEHPYDKLSRIWYRDGNSQNLTFENLNWYQGTGTRVGRRKQDRVEDLTTPTFKEMQALVGKRIPEQLVREGSKAHLMGLGLPDKNLPNTLLVHELPPPAPNAFSPGTFSTAPVTMFAGVSAEDRLAKRVIERSSDDPHLPWFYQHSDESEEAWHARIGLVGRTPNWLFALSGFLKEKPEYHEYWHFKLTQLRREQGLPDPSEQEALDLLVTQPPIAQGGDKAPGAVEKAPEQESQ